MVSSRRVRKRSTSTCPLLPTYVGLLEPLQLTLHSAKNTKHPLFILHVQRRNNSSWSFPHPFEAFETLHKRLAMALQHGHLCNAGCPWLFSLLTSKFPKKHIFQRNSSPRTVEARREKLLELLTSTLEFLLDRKNHVCSVVTTDVAKLFAEFLYGEDAVAQFIVESYSESETTSSNNNSHRRRSQRVLCTEEKRTGCQGANNSGELGGLTICGVCNGPVACEVESGERIANSGSRRRSSVYATVLQCGHQFHDECIVPVLDETLRCPTCHHLEIQ